MRDNRPRLGRRRVDSAVPATEEAIVNAMVGAETMTGFNSRTVTASRAQARATGPVHYDLPDRRNP